MKVLIIQLSPIGDIIRSTPVIIGLREKYRRVNISFLVDKKFSPLIAENHRIDRVIEFDRKSYREKLKEGALGEVFQKLSEFASELQREKFDLVINLHNTPLSAILTSICRPKDFCGITLDEKGGIIGKGFYFDSTNSPSIKSGVITYELKEIKDFKTNRVVKLFETNVRMEKIGEPKHIVDFYLNGAKLNLSFRRTEIFVGEKDLRFATQFLRANGVKESELLIGIQPGSLWHSRRWSVEKFAALCVELMSKYKTKLIIFGSKAEERLVEQLISKIDFKPINAQGKTSLTQLAALLRKCSFLITNNTGTMHISTAVSTKVISLFGAVDPLFQGPYGDGHFVLCARLPCLPCNRSFCKEHTCMKAIQVEDVLKAVELFLERNVPKGI